MSDSILEALFGKSDTDCLNVKLLSITVLLAVTSLALPASSLAQLSVTVSDNVVILDEKKKSGSIDLVNLGSDPVEFAVSPLGNDNTINENDYIRWAPSRVLVPANRSARLRVISKSIADIPDGELLVRLGITAAVQQAPRAVNRNEDTTDAIAVTVPIVPTLPLFVYIRNNGHSNAITLEPLVLTPEDKTYVGYFPISKTTAKSSFVGQVKVINKINKEVLSEGRVHLPQGTDKSLVRVLRSKDLSDNQVVHCIQLWDQYPGQGAPSQTVCP